MPHIAEGHKLLSRLNIPARRLTMPMLAAMLLGSVAAGWAALHLYYIDGAAAKWGPGYASVWVASQPLNEMVAKLSLPTGPNAGVAVALAMGLVGALVGMALRASPLKWPLHPVGYAVSTAWAMDHMWFSLFIAWAIKALIIRYGGSVGYRRAVPIAMGLILGDFLSGSLWSIYGVLKGIRAYSIWV